MEGEQWVEDFNPYHEDKEWVIVHPWEVAGAEPKETKSESGTEMTLMTNVAGTETKTNVKKDSLHAPQKQESLSMVKEANAVWQVTTEVPLEDLMDADVRAGL